jgi:ADP-ribosylglycohydrolase
MANWFLSKPIDVGNTIRNSVPKACNMKEHQAHLVRKGANEKSQTSQSNGTLMSISGLALWCKNLSNTDIEKAVREFTILIHPNESVVCANTAYVIAVAYLLNHQL